MKIGKEWSGQDREKQCTRHIEQDTRHMIRLPWNKIHPSERVTTAKEQTNCWSKTNLPYGFETVNLMTAVLFRYLNTVSIPPAPDGAVVRVRVIPHPKSSDLDQPRASKRLHYIVGKHDHCGQIQPRHAISEI